ncbi:putative receptor-like protein kinase At3g47110 [Asparagus officinalis]|uniref:putative receptor-like protein kinase At3g47110 n=1 Tax=Asparagus officinalis TaxID=4686 RepID=UPI00098E316E|nr:putative receptor-like protein kinase At3g47110 [Asparagus officinalis]
MIDFFELASNHLTGSVPPALGQSMPSLSVLNVERNELTGGLDFIASLSSCGNLQRLDFEYNEFDGFLPDSVGNLSKGLEYFSFGINHIKGNIPAALGNLSGLLHLDLGDNEIVAAIPASLGKIQSLQQLYLGNNQISGSIPVELGLLTSLSFLYLSGNKLSGAIPDSFGNITGLQNLLLSTNALSSKVPQSLWSLRSLVELSLSQNYLHGSISPQVGNLNTLDTLDLSENKFSGNITSSLGELQMLTYLDLSKNSFMGEIPQSFGGLISLKYLNLSNNLLSGDIPKSLANLRYLEILNLSFNMLVGQIPQGRVFSNLTVSSLEGNKGLCGAPRLNFSPCSGRIVGYTSRRKLHLLQCILPIISVLVVLSCLFLIFVIHRRRKTRNSAATDFQPLGEHRVVSYHDLARATNKFSEENLLGKGSFGTVYRGRLDDGLIVAVKILNMEVEGATKSFHAECETLSSVRHRNLIKIISTCSSLDFKALILQFMPNGSLEQWLHSENRCLNLLQRLNIMVDVSLALEYLHHNHPQVILHCDLKPSNILLDEEMVAHVSDFGIAKLLLGDGRSIASASAPGTIGYIAPEYGSTGNVSKMGDVYSFGILLLETFTGKRPTDVVFEGEPSLRECICKAYPTSIFDIIDNNLFKGVSLLERTSADQTAMHHCVLSVIRLGLLCTNYSPKERISMVDVVPRMQKIKMEYMSQLSTA